MRKIFGSLALVAAFCNTPSFASEKLSYANYRTDLCSAMADAFDGQTDDALGNYTDLMKMTDRELLRHVSSAMALADSTLKMRITQAAMGMTDYDYIPHQRPEMKDPDIKEFTKNRQAIETVDF